LFASVSPHDERAAITEPNCNRMNAEPPNPHGSFARCAFIAAGTTLLLTTVALLSQTLTFDIVEMSQAKPWGWRGN